MAMHNDNAGKEGFCGVDYVVLELVIKTRSKSDTLSEIKVPTVLFLRAGVVSSRVHLL